jgi:hypothetical protein
MPFGPMAGIGCSSHTRREQLQAVRNPVGLRIGKELKTILNAVLFRVERLDSYILCSATPDEAGP